LEGAQEALPLGTTTTTSGAQLRSQQLWRCPYVRLNYLGKKRTTQQQQ
jgi:hypothetical protein